MRGARVGATARAARGEVGIRAAVRMNAPLGVNSNGSVSRCLWQTSIEDVFSDFRVVYGLSGIGLESVRSDTELRSFLQGWY